MKALRSTGWKRPERLRSLAITPEISEPILPSATKSVTAIDMGWMLPCVMSTRRRSWAPAGAASAEIASNAAVRSAPAER
jgi:hypothetical protein